MSRKVALVTGGSRGIGLGICQALIAEGFDVAVNGMREEHQVKDTLDQLRQSGQDILYCQGDIGNATDRSRIIESVSSTFGQLNILVNNAGVAPKERNDLLEMSEQSYDRVIDTNLKGSFFLSQLGAKEIIKLKQKEPEAFACIINISSISATVVSINRGQYCISKAGMSMMTQLYAARLGKEGIPVYEIRPGIIESDMTSSVKEKYDKLFSEGLSVQARWGTPQDVGKTVGAIARSDFAYSTGQVFMVDGCITMVRL